VAGVPACAPHPVASSLSPRNVWPWQRVVMGVVEIANSCRDIRFYSSHIYAHPMEL
jgi:hypothetical protein